MHFTWSFVRRIHFMLIFARIKLIWTNLTFTLPTCWIFRMAMYSVHIGWKWLFFLFIFVLLFSCYITGWCVDMFIKQRLLPQKTSKHKVLNAMCSISFQPNGSQKPRNSGSSIEIGCVIIWYMYWTLILFRLMQFIAGSYFVYVINSNLLQFNTD